MSVDIDSSTASSCSSPMNAVIGFNLNTVGVTDQGAGAPFPAAYSNFSDSVAAAENYDTEPEFDYIENVPVSWVETVAVDGQLAITS